MKKGLFPVQRVARIKASREAGKSFFLDNFFYIIKDMENIQKKRRKKTEKQNHF